LLLLCFAGPVDPASSVALKVQRLLDEKSFLRRNQSRFAQLTKREREVLRLQVLGHSSQETAAALFISVHTVETHRRNIRQKLTPETAFELTEYAQAFNLL
jgi:DNA-binding CsgD family transcriptional regulator